MGVWGSINKYLRGGCTLLFLRCCSKTYFACQRNFPVAMYRRSSWKLQWRVMCKCGTKQSKEEKKLYTHTRRFRNYWKWKLHTKIQWVAEKGGSRIKLMKGMIHHTQWCKKFENIFLKKQLLASRWMGSIIGERNRIMLCDKGIVLHGMAIWRMTITPSCQDENMLNQNYVIMVPMFWLQWNNCNVVFSWLILKKDSHFNISLVTRFIGHHMFIPHLDSHLWKVTDNTTLRV